MNKIDFETWKVHIKKLMYHSDFSAESIKSVDQDECWQDLYDQGLKWQEAFTLTIELILGNS